MKINALFCDKRTSALLTLPLDASTQEEFNAQLQEAYLQACGHYDRFTIETETSDGDEQQLAQWLSEFEPQEGTFEEIEPQETAWQNDHLQFARLLKEVEMAGGFTSKVMQRLAASMDLEEAEITQVLERATCAYDDYVERHLPAGKQAAGQHNSSLGPK